MDAMTLMGDFLRHAEKQAGGRGKLGGGTRGSKKEPQVNSPPTLKDAGITKKESAISQKLSVAAEKEPEKASLGGAVICEAAKPKVVGGTIRESER